MVSLILPNIYLPIQVVSENWGKDLLCKTILDSNIFNKLLVNMIQQYIYKKKS